MTEAPLSPRCVPLAANIGPSGPPRLLASQQLAGLDGEAGEPFLFPLLAEGGLRLHLPPPPRSGLALLVRSGHALSKQKPWGEGGGLPCGRSEHPCCWWLLQLWGHWPSPQLLWPSTWSSPFPPAEPHIHQKPLVGSRAVPHGLLAPRRGSGATFSTSAEGCSVTDGLSSDTSQSLQSSPPLLLPLQPAELSVPPLLMLAA